MKRDPSHRTIRSKRTAREKSLDSSRADSFLRW
jgi:hypothetical protein